MKKLCTHLALFLVLCSTLILSSCGGNNNDKKSTQQGTNNAADAPGDPCTIIKTVIIGNRKYNIFLVNIPVKKALTFYIKDSTTGQTGGAFEDEKSAQNFETANEQLFNSHKFFPGPTLLVQYSETIPATFLYVIQGDEKGGDPQAVCKIIDYAKDITTAKKWAGTYSTGLTTLQPDNALTKDDLSNSEEDNYREYRDYAQNISTYTKETDTAFQ